MTRIEQEKRTVEAMVKIYCRHHEGKNILCEKCQKLLEYAHQRLDRCKFGNDKSSCRQCTVHCYRPDMREHMRAVMRYAGPRMMLYHPIMAIRHLWSER